MYSLSSFLYQTQRTCAFHNHVQNLTRSGLWNRHVSTENVLCDVCFWNCTPVILAKELTDDTRLQKCLSLRNQVIALYFRLEDS